MVTFTLQASAPSIAELRTAVEGILASMGSTGAAPQADTPEPKPKTAAYKQLAEAITVSLVSHGGESPYKVVVEDVKQLLQPFAAHKNFAKHVTWAASQMRKDGLLLNGHDHGSYGQWKLTDTGAAGRKA